jgi:hypothetical protein
MKNYRLARITNSRFSIRFCNIAKSYGFITVGSFEKALVKADSCFKWQFRSTSRSGFKLLEEITDFKTTYHTGE